MKKFRTRYDDRIEEVEVIKETAKFVVLEPNSYNSPRRDAKRSDNGMNYFDSWQEAKDFLIDREKTAMVKALREMQAHQETLAKIEAMHQ